MFALRSCISFIAFIALGTVCAGLTFGNNARIGVSDHPVLRGFVDVRRDAVGTVCTIRTGWTLNAMRTLCSGLALRTLNALNALRTLLALRANSSDTRAYAIYMPNAVDDGNNRTVTVCTVCTSWACLSGVALIAFRTLFTGVAFGSLWTGITLRSGRPSQAFLLFLRQIFKGHGAIRTLWPLWTNLALRSLRSGCASIALFALVAFRQNKV